MKKLFVSQSIEEHFDFYSRDDSKKTFKSEKDTYFYGAMLLSEYVSRVFKALKKVGFTEKNSLPCICTCRDEITFDLPVEFQKYYKSKPFDLSSLSGMLFGGITAFKAAQSHAPQDKDDKERYIFLAMPHIAIYKNGEIGQCKRKGREEIGHACGALISFQKELENAEKEKKEVDLSLNFDDMELSVLKQRLYPKIQGKSTDLVTLTKVAADVIQEDLERMVEKTVKNLNQNFYAVLTGVQIHGPNDETWIWPYSSTDYIVVDGKRFELIL